MPPIPPDHSLPAAWAAIEALQADLAARDEALDKLLNQVQAGPAPPDGVKQVAKAAKGEDP